MYKYIKKIEGFVENKEAFLDINLWQRMSAFHRTYK